MKIITTGAVGRCWRLLMPVMLLGIPNGIAAQESFEDEPIVDRQVAVLPLAGSSTSSIRALIDTSLQDVAIVVPLSDVEYSAARLGLPLEKDASLAELSKELLIDIFVRGSVRGGRSKSIALTFVDKDGEELSHRSYQGSLRGRGKAKFRAFVEESYREAATSLVALEEDPEIRQKREEDEDDYEGVTPMGIIEEDVEIDEDRAQLPLVNVQATIGARNRDALVRLRSSETRVYDALFFTELGLRLHARPYGNKQRDIQGLFVDAELAFAPFFSSVDDFGGVFDSSTFRLSADVGYRLKLDSVELGPVVGIGVDSFSIEERGLDPDGSNIENLVIPSATYWYVRGGVVAEVPLVGPLLKAQLQGGFRYAFGVGDLVPIFGDSGSALGFDVSAHASGALEVGFTYGVWVRYLTYSLSFSGNASNMSENASSGHDRAVSFGVALGYEFYDD